MSVDATTALPAETAAARCYAALPPGVWLPTRAICERAGLGYVSDGPLWTLYRQGRVTAQNGPPARRWCRKEHDMSNTVPDYDTGVTDSGDTQPEAPGTNMAAFYAAGARMGAAMEEAAQRIAAMQTGMLVGLQRPALQSSDDETAAQSDDETDAGSGDTGAPTPWMDRFDTTYWHAQLDTAIRALEQALATLTRVEAERDAALALVERALAVAQHWPVRVGGTITGGLYDALRALDGEARAYLLTYEHEPMPLDQALRAVQQVAAQHREPESE